MGLRAAVHHDQIPADAQVERIVLSEALNEAFDCAVDLQCLDPDLDLDGLLESSALVHVFDDTHDPADPEHARFVHGVIEEAEYVAPLLRDRHHYRLRLRPTVHALAYRFRTRIFQGVNPVDAIVQILREAGVAEDAVEWSVEAYPPREYVTQWKESELTFAHRWLETLGIRFFFEHDELGHRMILSDRPLQHEPIAGDPGLFVRQRIDVVTQLDANALYDVELVSQMRHERWAARDWTFMTPDAPRDAAAGEGGLERYDFPGGYADDETGAWLSEIRAQELIHDQTVLTALSSCRRLSPGRAFDLVESGQDFAIARYLVTRAEHRFERDDEDRAPGGVWETKLRAIPAEVPFRPSRVTPWPKAWGKESAVVTGPAGDEIHVDAMGRVKVHFYWDRENPVDDKASCWMRVQQLNTAGTMALPRVGWEVDVGFLYGDPDRPVVLQKLYNTEHAPPYPLPGNLMQSSLSTSSSPGGGGTNEIRMNDSGGAQEFFVHAQRDMATTIGNDASETITASSAVQVGADYTHKVAGDESACVGSNQNLSVTGGFVTTTSGDVTVTVGGLDDWGVGGVHSVTVAGSRTDDISGLMNVLAQKAGHTFNGSHTLSVGAAMATIAVGAITETTAGSKTELVGGAKLERITKAKAENIGVGKVLNAGAVTIKAGTDVAVGAEGALAIQTGGALESKCGGDFGISGRSVTFAISGSLQMRAGAKIDAGSGSIKIQGSSVGGKGAKVTLKGEVHYK